ncbi:pyridoxal 5'-phosphate synthase glutaminase subunit PdxT [candidate division KSB1 bacterium]|nr:pyridoxal 5'-phosphate synthase glutaminase subunit PdxT [candidate division KSB1 bacterium]
MTTGILAIQGDFEKHQQTLETLNCSTLLVKDKNHLQQCDGLIIPGGESTTLVNLLKKHGLWQSVHEFGLQKTIFGTCAGLILLANRLVHNRLDSLSLIDITVERNAYGRQIDSFIDTVDLQLNHKKLNFEGVFIRAPKIVDVGKEVKVLGRYQQSPVMVENEHIMASTFHPEITADSCIHQYFIEKVRKNSHDRS